MVLRCLRRDSLRGRRALDRLLRRGRTAVGGRVLRQARGIVRQVRRGGDRSLLELARRLDGANAASIEDLRLRTDETVKTSSLVPGFEASLKRAISAVERFHRHQVHEGFRIEVGGVTLEERRIPLQRVGLYVPGGRFPYPSTVVMSVVPARLAGVAEIVVTTPARAWEVSPELRFTLRELGVREIWGLGGAQAVAALAYGTESLERVDMIAGPGNAWVAAAKQLVSGDVGVDREAGPSEVVIVAAGDAPAELVAADLLAQAEHDPRAVAVLVTTDRGLARAVGGEIAAQLEGLATAETAREALRRLGAAFVVGDLEEALELVELLAPEHLQLVGEEAEELAPRVTRAGAVFVGRSTPVVFGDYVAGPSHVLPTAGTARFASGLGVDDFVRRTHTVHFSPVAAAEWARDAAVLAEVEGLVAHAAAAERREG